MLIVTMSKAVLVSVDEAALESRIAVGHGIAQHPRMVGRSRHLG